MFTKACPIICNLTVGSEFGQFEKMSNNGIISINTEIYINEKSHKSALFTISDLLVGLENGGKTTANNSTVAISLFDLFCLFDLSNFRK